MDSVFVYGTVLAEVQGWQFKNLLRFDCGIFSKLKVLTIAQIDLTGARVWKHVPYKGW
jgi:hypothetical protein